MEKDRRLELIDNAIQKLIHDNNHKDHDNNLKDHDAEYQLALSHLLSLSTQQLDSEMLKRDEKVEQSEASSPSEPVASASVIKKTEGENYAADDGEVDEGCKGSEKDDEIMKELKKVKRQNFLTHCLLSAVIVLTVAWQLSEVSLILKVKEGITNPFKSFKNMVKDVMKDKVPDVNGHVADKNKDNNQSTSFPSLNFPEMSNVDVSNLGK